MMYKAICAWRDMQDGHLYAAGDEFPHDGREIQQERIKSLLNGENKANKPLIIADDKLPVKETKPRKTAKKRA